MKRLRTLTAVATLFTVATWAIAATPDGKQVFDQHCAACHGPDGQGDGPAAVWLFPKPRDFSAGLFKIKSTPGTSLPTDDDLLRTVTRGLPGSSMPSFTYLSDAERHAAVEHVKYLTAATDASGKRTNHFDEAKKNGELAAPIQVPPEPPLTVTTLAEGKQLYLKLDCTKCHGPTGMGDGPSAPTLKDNWGFPLFPRDFNNGMFRGGTTGRDLYLRINTGLPGTPMPPFGDELIKPAQRWSLVHYIMSLRRKAVEINDILAPADSFIHAPRVAKKLPVNPADPFWETMDPTRVPVNPLWPEPDPIPAVAVRAVHDGKRVAILLQWRDAIENSEAVRVQDFQDAVAMQFSLNGTTAFLGMGDANNPVNIWKWNATWQAEFDDERPDVNTVYASMHVDHYPEKRTLFRTAEAAGNLLAQEQHVSPVEDANAWGFGTLRSQSAKAQNVAGRGFWRDGHWNVVFIRTLRSGDEGDVQFIIGKPVPVAFAVWNGQNRDRNGRKTISNWFQLILDPQPAR